MNFDERMAVIEDALMRFQARYTPPKAMSKDAQEDTFAAVCASINRKLPSKVTEQGLRDRLSRVFEYVSDRHETNAWPLQAQYTKAVNATAASGSTPASTEWKVDPVAHAARRIRAGEPVGQEWLFGRGLMELSMQQGITEADVKPYRDSLFYADRALVGEAEARRRQSDRIDRNVTEPYWSEPKKADLSAAVRRHIGGAGSGTDFAGFRDRK